MTIEEVESSLKILENIKLHCDYTLNNGKCNKCIFNFNKDCTCLFYDSPYMWQMEKLKDKVEYEL